MTGLPGGYRFSGPGANTPQILAISLIAINRSAIDGKEAVNISTAC